MQDIGQARYVSLTTYRRNGETRAVPVWIADLGDGTYGFTTDPDSWKVRRLRNDPRVEVQKCDLRGNVEEGSVPLGGTGRVADDVEHGRVREAIVAKYGLQARMMGLTRVLRRNAPEPVAVILDLG